MSSYMEKMELQSNQSYMIIRFFSLPQMLHKYKIDCKNQTASDMKCLPGLNRRANSVFISEGMNG